MRKLLEKIFTPSKLKIIIFTISLFLAGVILLSGLNKPHLSPFKAELEVTDLRTGSASPDGQILVDMKGNRMLFLNKDGKLMNIHDSDSSGSPVKTIDNTAVYNGKLYISGHNSVNDGLYLKSEKVISADLDGNTEKELYSHKYGKDEFVTSPHILHMLPNDKGILFAEKDNNTLKLTEYTNNSKKTQTVRKRKFPVSVIDALILPHSKTIAVTLRSQKCGIIDYSKKSGKLIYLEPGELIKKIEKEYNVDTSECDLNSFRDISQFSSVSYDKKKDKYYLTFFSEKNEAITFSDKGIHSKSEKQIPLSAGYYLKTLLHWISLAYLLLSLITFILYLILVKGTLKKNMTLLVIGAALLASVFYTFHDAKTVNNVTEQFLSDESKEVSIIVSATSGDRLAELSNSDNLRKKLASDAAQTEISAVQKVITNLSSSGGKKFAPSFSICVLDKKGNAYTYADTQDHTCTGIPVKLSKHIKMLLSGKKKVVTVSDNPYQTAIVGASYITGSNGKKAGIITTSIYQSNITALTISDAVNTSVNLLALFIAIYVLSMAIIMSRGELIFLHTAV